MSLTSGRGIKIIAKAIAKASVRARAIVAFRKATCTTEGKVQVYKSRSKETITVKSGIHSPIVWSYTGGKLRRLTASEAAGVKGLSACISGEYA